MTLPRTGSAPPETTGYQSIRALPFVPVVSHLHFAVIIVVAGASTDVIIEVDEQPPKALHLQPPHVVLWGKYYRACGGKVLEKYNNWRCRNDTAVNWVGGTMPAAAAEAA